MQCWNFCRKNGSTDPEPYLEAKLARFRYFNTKHQIVSFGQLKATMPSRARRRVVGETILGGTIPSMPTKFRLLVTPLIATAALSCLTGCASVNEKLSAGMGDYVPQWAGGLPRDAPPRPGTPEYDQFMKERERRRQMPAAERDKETQSNANAQAATPAR